MASVRQYPSPRYAPRSTDCLLLYKALKIFKNVCDYFTVNEFLTLNLYICSTNKNLKVIQSKSLVNQKTTNETTFYF